MARPRATHQEATAGRGVGGPLRVEKKIRTAVPGLDYMTAFEDWLGIQNGKIAGVNQFDSQARYIRNGRGGMQ